LRQTAERRLQSLPLRGGRPEVKLNNEPLTLTTDFVDLTADPAVSSAYFVRPVIDGLERESSAAFAFRPAAR